MQIFKKLLQSIKGAGLILSITINAQNTKPITLPDTLTLNLKDSGFVNLLANDYDQQGDAMKITKFDRWAISTFKSVKTDTAILSVYKDGKVCVRALKAGIFTFKYIVQDGKAGAGRTGYFVLKVKDNLTTANDWMDIGIKYSLVHKDSAGYISAYIGSKLYSGKVQKFEDRVYISGDSYRQWFGAELKLINKQFILYLPLETYGWSQL
jgi:hypothetical protein